MSFCVDDNEFQERLAETEPGEEQDLVLWFLGHIGYECDFPEHHLGHEEERQRWARELSAFLTSRGWK